MRLLQSAGLATSEGLYQLVRYLLLFALPTCAGLVLAAWRAQITFTLAAAFLVATVALWITSIGYTAGGLFYSMRVLSPVFALAAVLGGVVGAGLTPSDADTSAWFAILFAIVAPIGMWALLTFGG